MSLAIVCDRLDKRIVVSRKRGVADSISVRSGADVVRVVITYKSVKQIPVISVIELCCGVDVIAFLRVEMALLIQKIVEIERVAA